MVLPYWPLEQPASGFWTLQTLQNLALARLWALGSARLWAELRRLWARGSGAPNPFFLVARNCPSNASNPSNASTLAMVGFWTLQTLHGRFRRSKTSHLLDCGLWALCQTVGHTGRWSSQLLDSGRFRRSKTSRLPDCGLWALRDCGRSCAGCGLGALARQILFFLVARNCPSNASNPSNPSNLSNVSTLANGCAIRLVSGRFRRSMDASDAPKPRTC